MPSESAQVIRPKIRGFICITAHPEGCAAHVRSQIDVVKRRGPIAHGPRRVLILGSSTGYGLAARIAATFGCGADTLGVFFERPSDGTKPASAGWYNTVAFEDEARAAGRLALSLNGDAFSDDLKRQVVDAVREHLGQLDLVVYSLASPRRTDPDTGETFKSVLKPLGEPYHAKNLDTDRESVEPITIEPATPEERAATVKVMGGEDWERWIRLLLKEGLLAPGATTVAFDYIGPRLTWPVYHDGTIGAAKKHLRQTAEKLTSLMEAVDGDAFISVNKAVVTQASSAIPVVPLYISLLFKSMKARGLHEDCIEQMDRLFRDHLPQHAPLRDPEGRLRLDDLEMRDDVQDEVEATWPLVTTDNLRDLTDFAGYQENFLRLFGFGLPGVAYDQPVELDRPLAPVLS